MATNILSEGVLYVPDYTGLGIAPEIYLIGYMFGFMIILVGLFFFGPFIPYVVASIRKKKLLLTVDRTRQCKLMIADIRNGMYYFSNKPWRFVKQYPGTFWFGKGVPLEIVHVDQGFVQDPYMNAAVEELHEVYGIDNYKELEISLENGESPTGTAIDAKDEVVIPLFFTVPIDSLVRYGAVVPPADITGEVEDLVEDRKGEMAAFKKLIPYALFFVMVAMGGALAFVMITQ